MNQIEEAAVSASDPVTSRRQIHEMLVSSMNTARCRGSGGYGQTSTGEVLVTVYLDDLCRRLLIAEIYVRRGEYVDAEDDTR